MFLSRIHQSFFLFIGSSIAGVGALLYVINALLVPLPGRAVVLPLGHTPRLMLPTLLVGLIGLGAVGWVFRNTRLGIMGEALAGVLGCVFDATGFLANPDMPGLPGLLLLAGASITWYEQTRRDQGSIARNRLRLTALLPLGAAGLTLSPLMLNADTTLNVLPVALAAPVAMAFVVNLILPTLTVPPRPVLSALPLVFLFPLTVVVSVAISVARGQPADSAEVALAWGVGLLVSPLIGVVVMLFAALFGWLGSTLQTKPVIARVVGMGLAIILGYQLIQLDSFPDYPLQVLGTVVLPLLGVAAFGVIAARVADTIGKR